MVELIVKILGNIMYLRGGGHARSFNASPTFVPLPQSPWLMLPQRPQGAKTNTHGLPPFFNLTENKFYNINVHPHHHPSDYKVVGSLEGWLVIRLGSCLGFRGRFPKFVMGRVFSPTVRWSLSSHVFPVGEMSFLVESMGELLFVIESENFGNQYFGFTRFEG
ncbi:hypothetical protein FEM48_Zijuj06G0047800 [Ziziphus jujuba var. spinosa]|uniref:Uncharacterized protein n=1 Tax=Ziziphus jujuba var. spinosa TaxID=714518 RepID=A0A978V789_ZIZJJ|nr:hypothetical protein FEM48_Zijuj06G0047800 [Ziziphus jujuba var. spinosa]